MKEFNVHNNRVNAYTLFIPDIIYSQVLMSGLGNVQKKRKKTFERNKGDQIYQVYDPLFLRGRQRL